MIDTSTWKEFRIGDLFDIHPTKAYKLTNAQLLDNGDYPVIANSAYNNGIVGYSTKEPTEQGNMVTFSDTVDANTIFYQPNNFVGYPHVQGLYPLIYADKWNEYTYSFFVSVFRGSAISKGFDYGNKFRRDIAVDLIIKLPITSTGEPDWDYMESYMCRIEEKAEKNLEALRKVKTESREIDTSEWGEFKIEDLFEKPVNTGNILAREVDDGSGTTPFVTASSINNGVTAYVDASKFDIIKGDCILVGGKTFTLTYQADDFISNDSHNFVMRLKHSASNYQYEYIVSVLRSSLSHIYSWGDAVTVKKIVNDKIKLPVAPSGEPDWAYMESYMKQMEEKAEKNLTGLICASVEFDGGKAIA